MSVTDHSGTHWMTVFDEESKKLLGGVTADELENYRSEGSESKYEEAFQKANFTTYVMKCRVKAEQVNDEERVSQQISNTTILAGPKCGATSVKSSIKDRSRTSAPTAALIILP